jgi:hypothetical protein
VQNREHGNKTPRTTTAKSKEEMKMKAQVVELRKADNRDEETNEKQGILCPTAKRSTGDN